MATPRDDLVQIFSAGISNSESIEPNWNVSPSQSIYAITVSGSLSETEVPIQNISQSNRMLNLFKWGLIPSWAKDPSSIPKPINARCETLASKPMFRKAFSHNRCLIPADGFFEWKRDPATKSKVPFYFSRPTGEVLAFAGLWETWHPADSPDTDVIRTCTIITTAANSDVRAVHDRMPAILENETWDAWLETGETSVDCLQELLRPAPGGTLSVRRVSQAVNRPVNNGPQLIETVEY